MATITRLTVRTVEFDSDEEDAMVNFEVFVRSADGSAFASDGVPSVDDLPSLAIDRNRATQVARRLQEAGIRIEHIGEFSISASCSERRFESLFNTKLTTVELDPSLPGATSYQAKTPISRVEAPAIDGLQDLIERVYVQPAPLLFAERTLPPQQLLAEHFRLRVPGDVAQIMEATPVHQLGYTGRGVRVAMVDTGFYPHPYFVEQGYDVLAVAAPDVTLPEIDAHGHGTGESANLFATAPGVNFVGVKMGNPTLAFRTAVDLKPDVITCSWGFHVDLPGTNMPNFLMPLYLEVLRAVNAGIVVCFSAGNGHLAFPANIPQVIAVGGTVVDESLQLAATEYTSGFESNWFPGRRVPDITGLCGTPPTADYIVLPVPAGATLDRVGGWGAFSGTSAASPMVAGVVALLRQIRPGMAPADIKLLLQHTATDVVDGKCAQGHPAGPGPDLATGFGLVNARRAVDVLL